MASIEAVTAALALFDKMPQWYKELTKKGRDDRAEIYEVGLRDLTDRELLTAAELAIGSCKWFPVPVELKELVRPKTAQSARLRDAAEDAYNSLVSAYERGEFHSFGSICNDLGEPAARAFLAAGGSSVFEWCEPGPDQAFRQKRFIESYLLHAEAEQAVGQLGEPGKQAIGRGEAVEILKKLGEGK